MRVSLLSGILLSVLSLAFAGVTAAQSCPSVVWSAGQVLTADDSITNLVTIDYDEDGKLDLAGLIQSSPDKLVTWRGLGDGTFSEATVLLTGTSNIGGELSCLNTADVNGDGHTDLIVSIVNTLRFYPGTGTGLGAPVDVSASYRLSRAVVGNFDGDPAPELVATAPSDDRFLFFDNVSGAFDETAIVETGEFPGAIASADFDGDGFHDVAVSQRTGEREGKVDVYFGAAGGTFSAPISLDAGDFPSAIRTADFDGDGHPDLAASAWYDGTITVFRYAGSRQFTPSILQISKPQTIFTVNADVFLARDVNGDGIADVVAGALNFGTWVTTFIGAGDGTFYSPTYSDHPPESPVRSMAVGDFDLDGDSDLALGAFNRMTITAGACTTQVNVVAETPTTTVGDTAYFGIIVSGFGSGTQQPYGTVTLRKDDGTELGTAVPDATGRAGITVSSLGVGTHGILAEFSGNAGLGGATSEEVAQRVVSTTTQTVISTPATPPTYGTPWRIRVSVVGGWNSDEWIQLSVDGVVTTRRTTENIDLSFSPGPHTIFAKFNGRSDRPASTSATLNVTAIKATPVVALASGAKTVKAGQSHALLFSVTGPNGTTPTGIVQLFSGNTLLGSGPVGSVINVTLPRGAHNVQAGYAGDGNFTPAALQLTLDVLPNQPLVLEARSLASAIQIAFVLPEGTTAYELNRRPAGTTSWQWLGSWNKTTGVDNYALVRGVVYEYQIEAVVDGTLVLSNIDGALLFTDDPLTVQSTRVKRAHFTELREAVNLMRTTAGLQAFQFDAAFTNDSIIRAAHVNALRTAVSEARNALGMYAPAFTNAVATGTSIRATDIEELRNASR